MEKPNITPGEWKADRYYVEDSDEKLIAQSYRCIDSPEDHANAQAISAVPDMIDALMEAREAFIKIESEWQGAIPQRRTIEHALKKAGCTE